jgi:hypothetical protein
MGLLLGSLATAQRLTGMERPSSCKLTAVAVESRNFRMGSVGWLYEVGTEVLPVTRVSVSGQSPHSAVAVFNEHYALAL